MLSSISKILDKPHFYNTPPQPTLGLEVRNRRQLLERLRYNDQNGLGGIPMSEIREAVHNPDKAMAVSGIEW